MIENLGKGASTRARLLDVAERLFLAHGYDAVSVRTINAEAGMNPAAVNYHFGTKEDLVAALLEDRLGPLPGAPGEGLEVEAIVALAVDPLVTLAATDERGRLHVRLLSRTIREGWPVHFASDAFSLDRWADAVAAAVPELPRPVVGDRWRLAVGMILDVVGRVDVDRDVLVRFLVGGLTVPQ